MRLANVQSRPVDQLILITGAAGGLGRAFAVECASRGWDLFLTDQYVQPLETLASCLRSTYRVSVSIFPSDLTDTSSRSALFTYLKVNGLKFTGLINIAGVDFEGLFLEKTASQIQTIIRLNVEGTLAMTHGILEMRDPKRTFRILNVASLAAFSPMPVKATYAASKRFIVDFSLALREEMRDQNVAVTVLCPAGMPTTSENIKAIDAQGWLGQVTTRNVGTVAALSLDYALAGKAICVPGMINQMLQGLSMLTPAAFSAGLIGMRWKAAHRKREVIPQPA
jgi:uncharacterized protein